MFEGVEHLASNGTGIAINARGVVKLCRHATLTKCDSDMGLGGKSSDSSHLHEPSAAVSICKR